MGYMEGLTLSDVIESTRGHWTGQGDPTAIVPTGVSIDTRTLKPGEIFFALPGEKVDGHQFLDAAFARGACAAVVARSGARESWQALIVVDAPDLALGDLARFYRRRFDIPVIGITGSSGKTTTKDMVAAVLNTRYRVLATRGNLNNRLGVRSPYLTVGTLRCRSIEIGAITERGGMRYLCELPTDLRHDNQYRTSTYRVFRLCRGCGKSQRGTSGISRRVFYDYLESR